jgi:hypothetical protein
MAKIRMRLNPQTRVNVTAAGTPVPLSLVPTETKALIVQAAPGNSGNIFIGDAGVLPTRCILLEPGRSIEITPDDTAADEDTVFVDLAEIFVDAATSGDGVFIAVLNLEQVQY